MMDGDYYSPPCSTRTVKDNAQDSAANTATAQHAPARPQNLDHSPGLQILSKRLLRRKGKYEISVLPPKRRRGPCCGRNCRATEEDVDGGNIGSEAGLD